MTQQQQQTTFYYDITNSTPHALLQELFNRIKTEHSPLDDDLFETKIFFTYYNQVTPLCLPLIHTISNDDLDHMIDLMDETLSILLDLNIPIESLKIIYKQSDAILPNLNEREALPDAILTATNSVEDKLPEIKYGIWDNLELKIIPFTAMYYKEEFNLWIEKELLNRVDPYIWINLHIRFLDINNKVLYSKIFWFKNDEDLKYLDSVILKAIWTLIKSKDIHKVYKFKASYNIPKKYNLTTKISEDNNNKPLSTSTENKIELIKAIPLDNSINFPLITEPAFDYQPMIIDTPDDETPDDDKKDIPQIIDEPVITPPNKEINPNNTNAANNTNNTNNTNTNTTEENIRYSDYYTSSDSDLWPDDIIEPKKTPFKDITNTSIILPLIFINNRVKLLSVKIFRIFRYNLEIIILLTGILLCLLSLDTILIQYDITNLLTNYYTIIDLNFELEFAELITVEPTWVDEIIEEVFYDDMLDDITSYVNLPDESFILPLMFSKQIRLLPIIIFTLLKLNIDILIILVTLLIILINIDTILIQYNLLNVNIFTNYISYHNFERPIRIQYFEENDFGFEYNIEYEGEDGYDTDSSSEISVDSETHDALMERYDDNDLLNIDPDIFSYSIGDCGFIPIFFIYLNRKTLINNIKTLLNYIKTKINNNKLYFFTIYFIIKIILSFLFFNSNPFNNVLNYFPSDDCNLVDTSGEKIWKYKYITSLTKQIKNTDPTLLEAFKGFAIAPLLRGLYGIPKFISNEQINQMVKVLLPDVWAAQENGIFQDKVHEIVQTPDSDYVILPKEDVVVEEIKTLKRKDGFNKGKRKLNVVNNIFCKIYKNLPFLPIDPKWTYFLELINTNKPADPILSEFVNLSVEKTEELKQLLLEKGNKSFIPFLFTFKFNKHLKTIIKFVVLFTISYLIKQYLFELFNNHNNILAGLTSSWTQDTTIELPTKHDILSIIKQWKEYF